MTNKDIVDSQVFSKIVSLAGCMRYNKIGF